MHELWAVIFHIWRDAPIFHGVRGGKTLCGRSIGAHVPSLPMKHAVRFARPCRSCYPESE